MQTHATLLLASGSPRRRELLAQMGVACEVLSVDLDESVIPGESPGAYVQRLSEAKAMAGLLRAASGQPVLGADTSVVCDERILGKPVDRQQGIDMLLALSARSHFVYTSVSVALGKACYTELSITEVHFREISPQEAAAYWLTGEPVDKAGGYGIQGLAAVFVESITGSYSGVVGLPIEATARLLAKVNIAYWQSLTSPPS